MKRNFCRILYAAFLVMSPLLSVAQTPPHPNGGSNPGPGNGPVGGGAPIGGGTLTLFLLA